MKVCGCLIPLDLIADNNDDVKGHLHAHQLCEDVWMFIVKNASFKMESGQYGGSGSQDYCVQERRCFGWREGMRQPRSRPKISTYFIAILENKQVLPLVWIDLVEEWQLILDP